MVVSVGGASWEARYLSTAFAKSSGKVIVARFMDELYHQLVQLVNMVRYCHCLTE